MRYIILDHLIYKNDPSVLDTGYYFVTKEGSFLSRGKETFVLHKKQLKVMSLKEVGDGMEIPYLVAKSDRSMYDKNLDIAACVHGISVYQWFDEKIGEKLYYAYGMDRSRVEGVNTMLTNIGLDLSLEDGKFVRIHNGDFNLGAMQQMIDNQDSLSILSFIFGIVLIYGHLDWVDDALSHITMQVPLVDSIALLEDQLLKMIEILFDQGLFLTYAYQDRKNGQTLQININDQEILDLYSLRLGGKKYDMSLINSLLQAELGDDRDLSDYVLKFLHK